MKFEDDEQPSGGGFFDKNTLLAIALSFTVFFGWNAYLAKKYPNANKNEAATAALKKTNQTNAPDVKQNMDSTESVSAPAAVSKEMKKETIGPQTLTYNSDKIEIDFSNDGFGIKKLLLKDYTDRAGKTIQYDYSGTDTVLMGTDINGAEMYNLKQISENEFEGTLSQEGMLATKRVVIDPNQYLLKTDITVHFDQHKKLELANTIIAPIEHIEKTFLLPAYEHQEIFAITPEKTQRELLTIDKAVRVDFGTSSVVAWNAPYFALASINTAEMQPTIAAASDGKMAKVNIHYNSQEAKSDYKISYNFYFGPKKSELLAAVDENLKELVDYGMFAFIGRPLLAFMKMIYSVIHNWGIAIIILTILVKLVLFPLHMYSIKSMKKMQNIQPRLKEIKEKYKNDPQRMNQETIQLMRSEKANPVSGCLPALLQMPIFFALYSMLGRSFELYKQPFVFWVHDLSVKDPYFVLPVLAGLVFFIQMKVTPRTSVDPAQEKVMMFMPIMIMAFTLTVPSGLALYMFVNALFSVFQQLLVTRERTT